ncbi:unnamed protein product [Pleuronectes platessa]|uniref:Uncharacterized protein n=1 Tax=Pleuronectes platessa TaxID=8262 RepID=A0A9N7VJZ8_PLEPL|nr:unnamed protein product [Pleuronectes platessa]
MFSTVQGPSPVGGSDRLQRFTQFHSTCLEKSWTDPIRAGRFPREQFPQLPCDLIRHDGREKGSVWSPEGGVHLWRMAEGWKLEGVGPHWVWSEQGGGVDLGNVRLKANVCFSALTDTDR